MKSFVFICILLIVNVINSFAVLEMNCRTTCDLKIADDYGSILTEKALEEDASLMLAAPLIINSQDTVLFDFSNAFCTPSYMQVPVKFNSDDMIYAMDFALQFDPGVFTYMSIINHQSYLSYSANYNSSDSTLRFTSFSFQPMDNNTNLISIRFSLPVSQIDYAQFDSVYTLLNGDISSSKAIESIPPAVISVGGPIIIFPGDSVSLSFIPVQGLSYLWSNGETDSLIYVNSPGTYYVNTFFPNGCNSITSIQIFAPDPLPVELIKFESKVSDDGIDVFWSTASEINNDYFIVERSVDGISWKDIGSIEGAGTTNSLTEYFFKDKNPEEGTNYYRLVQVDYDGQNSYSKVISAYSKQVDEISIPFSIYPNPAFSRNIFVSCGQKDVESLKEILIYNVFGEIVLKMTVDQSDNLCIGSDLALFLPEGTAAGTLLVVFLGDSMLYSQKLVLF